MQLFYHPDIHETTQFFSFDKEESRHLIKVLRKNTGNIIAVTNGKSRLFEAEIINADFRKCRLKVNKVSLKTPGSYTLHMAVAPTKMNDRYEWFLEKAVEIGVTEITPVICRYSERRAIKPERFKKIMIAAMKQSFQYQLPGLNEAMAFQDFIDQSNNGRLFIAHCEDSERSPLQNNVKAGQQITILIGPEGDFSGDEIRLASEKGFIPVSLGRTRLRTETAAITACHTIALINEQ